MRARSNFINITDFRNVIANIPKNSYIYKLLYTIMHPLVEKFERMIASGEIKDFQPIPNLTFSLEELQYLYRQGYIYESDNKFIATIPDVLD